MPRSVFERPYALIGHALTHKHLDQCVDSNCPKHLALMWLAFAGQSETALAEFTLGQQLIELLTSVGSQNKADSIFHLSDNVGLLATAQLGSQSVAMTPDATPVRVWEARWTRRPAAALPPPHFTESPMTRILGHYCRATTSRLFKTRLQAAEFFADPAAPVLLDDLDEQSLTLLIAVRQGAHRFDALVDSTGMEDTRLGNALIGLHLCGLVTIKTETKLTTLLAPREALAPSRGLKLLGPMGLNHVANDPSATSTTGTSLIRSTFSESVGTSSGSFSLKFNKDKGKH